MAMITSIRHFMDGDKVADDMPEEAQELLKFLTAIIETATEAYGEPISVSTAGCRIDICGQRCYGNIEVWMDADSHQIGWECIECQDEGAITDWEGTPWDKRNFTLH